MFLSFGKYCISKPKIPLFLMGIILILGFLSVFSISKESAPYIEYGIVTVTTVNSGVGAEDMDSTITQKLENKIKPISGIDKMESTSKDGLSNIVLTLKTDAIISDVISDVRSAVDDARQDLPSSLENDPRVAEIDSSGDRPFVNIALTTNSITDWELSEIAEKLKLKLEKISGVERVKIPAKVDTEVQILLDKHKIEALNLSYNQIQNAIFSSEQNISLGTFTNNQKEYSLRFQGESESLKDLENIVVGSVGKIGENFSARSISLKEIATVQFSAKDKSAISKFNGKQGIVLRVSRSGGGDVFATEKKVFEVLNAFLEKPEIIKKNIEHVMYTRATEQMTKDYKNLIISFLFSVVVVLIAIFIFVGVREGIIASVVIPVSFLGTIFVLFLLGRTMNFMTNFGMILALGILVDTAIVMVEGASHYVKKGLDPKEASWKSFKEFASPLFSGMLTTLIVFLPLFFLPGIVGKFLSFIPVTVTIVLTVALFVSLFIIPALTSLVLKNETHNKINTCENIRNKIDKKITKVINWYTFVLEKILKNNLFKYGIFALTVIIFIASLFIPAKFEMFPTADSDRISITLELPNGASSQSVIKKIEDIKIEKYLQSLPETSVFSVVVNNNIADILLELTPFKDRENTGMRTSSELETKIVSDFKNKINKNEVFQVQREKKGPPSKFPVGFNIKIEDVSLLQDAKKITQKLTLLLKTVSGTQGVTNSIKEIPGEYNFIIDKEKALLRGINPLEIPSALQGAVYGRVVSTFSKKGNSEDLDVRLQVNPKQIEDVKDILSLEISPNVKLSDIANVKKDVGLASVSRDEGDLVFTVSSFLSENGNAEEVTKSFLKLVAEKQKTEELIFPAGIILEDASENKDNEELMKTMRVAFVMAILMMFFILVIQFEAYSPPLLILQTVIFAQIGVSIGLFLTGTDKSMSYMLGIISLSGIVVNDAIILVDKIRENVFSQKFTDNISSVLDAGKTRFIPVVLTTITTSAGIFPLIFIDSFWAGLAYTIIFGLSVSSLLTLFLIPIGYLLFDKKNDKK